MPPKCHQQRKLSLSATEFKLIELAMIFTKHVLSEKGTEKCEMSGCLLSFLYLLKWDFWNVVGRLRNQISKPWRDS